MQFSPLRLFVLKKGEKVKIRFLRQQNLPVLSRSLAILLLCDTYYSRRYAINTFRAFVLNVHERVHDMKFPVPLFFFSSLGRHEEKAVKLRGLIHLKYCFLLIFQRGKPVSRHFIK